MSNRWGCLMTTGIIDQVTEVISFVCYSNRPSDRGGNVTRIQYASNPKVLRSTLLERVKGLVSRKTRYSICCKTGRTVPLIRLAILWPALKTEFGHYYVAVRLMQTPACKLHCSHCAPSRCANFLYVSRVSLWRGTALPRAILASDPSLCTLHPQ
jgi:hypothetical protein